jgi:crossover junction endodeoxyribonuclease RusA
MNAADAIAPTLLSFTIPGAPVPKARARVSRQTLKDGRIVTRSHTPAKTASYEKHVGMFARSARPRNWPLECAYKVSFIAYVDEDRADIDNYLKSLLDGAEGVLWANDKSVRRIGSCEVILGDPNPRMVVEIETLMVGCASCPMFTLYPVEKRCHDCALALAAKRAKRAA